MSKPRKFRLLVGAKLTKNPEHGGWTPDGEDKEIPLCKFRVRISKAATLTKEDAPPEEDSTIQVTAWGEFKADMAGDLRKGDYVAIYGMAQWRESEGRRYCNMTSARHIEIVKDGEEGANHRRRMAEKAGRSAKPSPREADANADMDAAEAQRQAEAETASSGYQEEEDIPF